MISNFTGDYRFLSNFSPNPVRLPLMDNLVFPTGEHAYQACKAVNMQVVMSIRSARSPGEAKRLGRQITIRDDWDQISRRVMLEVLLAKFSGDKNLTAALEATGDEVLVEGNTWGDVFWGATAVATGDDLPDNPQPGVNLWVPETGPMLTGKNWLGRLLMMTREVVR